MKKTPVENSMPKGTCNFCNVEIDKSKMTQHLKYCKQRLTVNVAADASAEASAEAVKTKFFHIIAEGRHNPQYWMHIEIPASDALEELDYFFRVTWVECCNHLSAFQIGDISYSDDPEDFYFADEEGEDEGEEATGEAKEEEEGDQEPRRVLELEELPPQLVEALTPELLLRLREFSNADEMVAFLREELKTFPKDIYFRAFAGDDSDRKLVLKQMLIQQLIDMLEDRSLGVPLEKVLKVGQKFRYEYDFGSTTELILRVAGERDGFLVGELDEVRILARNLPPEIMCMTCGKPATKVAAGYDYWGVMEHAFCDDCAKKVHEDAWLPIVNSPRVGVCGYTGEDDAYIEVDEDEDEWDEDEDEGE